jgi:hypothetical protein
MGERLTEGAVPVPLSETVCGLPFALSVTDTLPVALPIAVGEKLTLIVQEPPADRLEPQLLVSAKPALGTISEIVRAAPPVLVRITGCDWLVVPTS